MTDARGIVAAGVIALVVTGAHAGYRSWPVARGTEICVPATLVRQPGDLGLAEVRLPFSRIALDVPHTTPASTETFEPVRRAGEWWIAGGGAGANARRLRGRPLYLQLVPGQPLWTGGPVDMRASTLSDALMPGAVNLAGRVTLVREDGYIRLDFAFAPMAVPASVPADARVAAVLRVLPSGRATLVGVIANGTRY
jgi:hypothetical protein